MNHSIPLAPSCQVLLAQYGPNTPLAAIHWQELPACLQKTCDYFIKCWWDDIDIDQTIEASGLSNMTLAELLDYHEKRNQPCAPCAGKRYRLVAFIRVDPADSEPFTCAEALAEKGQQELLFPENIYRIEEAEPTTPAHRKEISDGAQDRGQHSGHGNVPLGRLQGSAQYLQRQEYDAVSLHRRSGRGER